MVHTAPDSAALASSESLEPCEVAEAAAGEAEEFEVESLLRERRGAGGSEFLVRWLGYGPEEDSWEPEGNVAAELVADFRAEAKQARQAAREREAAKGHEKEAAKVAAKAHGRAGAERAAKPASDSSDEEEPAAKRAAPVASKKKLTKSAPASPAAASATSQVQALQLTLT